MHSESGAKWGWTGVSLLMGLGQWGFVCSDVSAQEVRAFVGGIRGDVQVNGKRLTAPVEVPTGARLSTGLKSGCTLIVGQSQVVLIGVNTQLVLTEKWTKEQQSRTTIDIQQGRARALIRSGAAPLAAPRFFIRSRSVSMGVRGTEIYVETPTQPNSPPLFATLRGEAELRIGSQPPITVAAREAFRAGGSGSVLMAPVRTENLSAEKVAQIQSETGGKAPEIRNRDDMRKPIPQEKEKQKEEHERLEDRKSGLESDSNAPPPADDLPPPPPRSSLPDPVKDGRVTARVRGNFNAQ